MSTDAARKMLEAARRRPCGHESSYTCAHCEGRIRAQVWLEGLSAPDFLRGYIGAVEALGNATTTMAYLRQCISNKALTNQSKLSIAKDRKAAQAALAEWKRLWRDTIAAKRT